MNKTITVETIVHKNIETVWNFWNAPEHIEKWMHASPDWECSKAVNDVRVGGDFSFTLRAKDKSISFDFVGVYTAVEPQRLLAYTLGDGRTVAVSFTSLEDGVHVLQTFEMENENTEELQRSGWQATLDSFKSYVEGSWS